MIELDPASLHPALTDPALTAMNFLNEVASCYPDAVSFAPGRPFEEFWDVAQIPRYLERFCEHLRKDRGMDEAAVVRTLHQYGRTKGVIADIVARHLGADEGITAAPDAVVVTVGCQEAMVLVLRALRATDRDVVLAVDPTYVGLTGAARLVDMPVLPVASGAEGVDREDLARCVAEARAAGLRPRALYVMPDFANPTGLSMPEEGRRALLETAEREDILLLEDNPYGLFCGAAERPPTLKALDTTGRVVYLGSFAKTVLPGARVGYVVADQRVRGSAGIFADELAKIKSMITVNTSPISQAIVAGRLLENDGSLDLANTAERHQYQRNLSQLIDGLGRRLGSVPGVSWNQPRGGFFVVVTVPVAVGDAELEYSGRAHGVLWTPMRHFYGGAGGEHQLRLSCSSLDGDRIEQGLDRLAAFLIEAITSAGGICER
ncbi:GntR family transcriptional regulator [Micromonospora sonchi]|uniref:GntR family transcriptional regulator n=2 Tax=Micromonospora sonchi TaxID=1763543 RepID=A0A917X0C4_9ACTN|nr:GntR family transcriptional regulator [Micromonospora sonchi]